MPKFNRQKFMELLLYVADKSLDDPSFGATKLNKILFFSDFLAYGRTRRPITGATYQRLERGPAPRELLPAQDELCKVGDAIVVEQRRFNYPQKRLIPLREADLSAFVAEEIALVDKVIDLLRAHNAASVSALSHDIGVGWQIADDGTDIPYEAVFLSADTPTPTDVKRGRELAQQHGWLATL